MSEPRLVAVVGRQRSGTTVLRQFIGSTRRSFDLGEVFHALTVRQASFWGFLHQRASADARYRFPLHWHEVWSEFVRHQNRLFASDVIAIDLKIEYFPMVLRTDGMTANFFFDGPEMSYIRLHRRNTAAMVISRLVAAATNVWMITDQRADPERLRRHYYTWGGAPGPTLSPDGMIIEPEVLRHEIDAVRRQDEAIDTWLGKRYSLRLAYEDMFDSTGKIAGDVAEQIAGVCAIPIDEFDRMPILMKQRTRGMLAEIANAPDIVSAFRATPYEWMFADALSGAPGVTTP